MSFAALKRNSKKTVENLKKALNEEKDNYEDLRYWKFKVDEAGNGFAVIRFLSACDGEEVPFVKRFSHFFKEQSTNKWFINHCPTTIGKNCPVCEANSELWNTGIDSNKEIVRGRKRTQKYISNILVISDPKNTDNEGKVFLWEYGPRIFQKIELAINPPEIDGDDDPDLEPFDPFDFWGGANFRLKARKVDGQRSYDLSKFDRPTALFDGDDKALEELWKSQYPLQPEIAENLFGSYDELKTKFEDAIGKTASRQVEKQYDDFADKVNQQNNKPNQQQAKQEPDMDDDMAAYAKLLED